METVANLPTAQPLDTPHLICHHYEAALFSRHGSAQSSQAAAQFQNQSEKCGRLDPRPSTECNLKANKHAQILLKIWIITYNLWSIQQVFHQHKTFGSRRQGMHVVAHALSLAHTWHHITDRNQKNKQWLQPDLLPCQLNWTCSSHHLERLLGHAKDDSFSPLDLYQDRVRIRLKLSVAICKARESIWLISLMHSRNPQDPQCIYQRGPKWYCGIQSESLLSDSCSLRKALAAARVAGIHAWNPVTSCWRG